MPTRSRKSRSPRKKVTRKKKVTKKGPRHMKHWLELFRSVIEAKAIHRILLWGPPGTGKSSAPSRTLSGVPIFRVPVHEETAEECLVGYQIDIGEKGIVDGSGVLAMEQGGILVLDEIDKRHPSLDGVLHAILDDFHLAQIRTRSGRVVKPKVGYTVVATTNQQPDVLSEALLDRFEVCIRADCPPDEALAMLSKDSHTLVHNHYKAQDKVKFARPMSLRRIHAFEALRKPLGDDVAADAVFGSSGKEVVSCLASVQLA